MVALAFLEQPGFVEGDFFGGVVFGFGGGGKEDGVFAELVVDGVDGFAEFFSFRLRVEEGGGDEFGFSEAGERDADFGGLIEVAALPEFEESFANGDGVVGCGDAGFYAPRAVVSSDGEVDVFGDDIVGSHAGAGFVEEAEHDASGAFVGAEVGGEDVGVTKGFAFAEVVGHVVTAEEVPPTFALDGAEDAGEVAGGFGEEVVGGEDAVGVEARLHADVDPAEFYEVETEETGGEVLVADDDESVGLLEVGSEFGEEGVGGDSDGAGEAGREFGRDGGFDGLGDFSGLVGFALFAEEAASHFVDRADFVDGEVFFDALDDAVVIVGVFGGGGLDADELRAHLEGVADFGAGFDAELLGFVAGGDDGAGVAFGWGDAHGDAAQVWVFRLLDACEIAIEIQVQPPEGEFWPKW